MWRRKATRRGGSVSMRTSRLVVIVDMAGASFWGYRGGWPARQCGGGTPNCLREGGAEGLRGSMARTQGPLDDAVCGGLQRNGRGFQPQPPHVLGDAFADQAAENTMEVVWRKVGHPGQPLQRQFLVEVLLDEELH